MQLDTWGRMFQKDEQVCADREQQQWEPGESGGRSGRQVRVAGRPRKALSPRIISGLDRSTCAQVRGEAVPDRGAPCGWNGAPTKRGGRCGGGGGEGAREEV